MSFRRYFDILRNIDWILFGSVFLLISFGLAALYSIAISSDVANFANFSRQIFFIILGFGVFLVMTLVGYQFWHAISSVLFLGSAALLLLVLFFGQVINGTKGWFYLFGFGFQPVELAKFGLIVFLAAFLSRRITQIKEAQTFWMSALSVGILFTLVVLQPDFGSAIVLLGIWFLMIFLAGANRLYLLSIIGALVIGFVVSWAFLFQDYQKDRILTFLNPSLDPYGRGYHVRQATIAAGAGGVLGRGLGFGSQSQLKFIPESHTDFIFSVIAEELGFVGVSLILFFWGLFFYRLVLAAGRIRDDFATLFILGTSVLFFIHLFINIGMNIGILPVTGIPLPFISYGGSFMIVSLAMLGLIEGMIARSRI